MSTKTALITGASSGIGEATARQLQGDGYIVYAGARRVERMQGLADNGIRVLSLDVTDDDSMVAAVDSIIGEHGRIDVLVNNAGYGSYGAAEDVPMSEARYQLEVNLFGLARLTQLVAPHMRIARSGRIVNVSSIGGKFGESLGAWYHASKFAVEGYSDSVRMELAEFGIQVVVVEPGPIATEWGAIALDSAATRSGHTPYAGHVAAMKRAYEASFTVAADPSVIAEVIHHAVTSRHPRIRYVAPRSTMALGILLKHLPDRAKDLVLRQAMMGGGIKVDEVRPTEADQPA